MMILKKVAGYKKGARLAGARISASNRLGGGKKNLQRGNWFWDWFGPFDLVNGLPMAPNLVNGLNDAVAGVRAGELVGVVTRPDGQSSRRSSVVKAFGTARVGKQAIRYYVGCVTPAMVYVVSRTIDAACDAGVWLERVTRRAVVARGGDWKAGQGRGGLAVGLYQILLMGSLNADIGAKAVHP